MRRDNQPDPVTRIADAVAALVDPYRHPEVVWRRHGEGRRRWLHTSTHPSLLDQLRHAAEPGDAGEPGPGGHSFESRAAANLDALHRLAAIHDRVKHWRVLFGQPPRPRLEDQLRAMSGWAARADVDIQKRMASDAERWATWCRILGGWEDPPWRPPTPCPCCGKRADDDAGLRVRFDTRTAICLSCEATWGWDRRDDDGQRIPAAGTIEDLADYIRTRTATSPPAEPTDHTEHRSYGGRA